MRRATLVPLVGAFLAILCDEIQEWGRERRDNPPGARPYETVTWGLFRLEAFGISREKVPDPEHVKVALTFIARDYPEVIASRYGSDGTATVRGVFENIAKTLRTKLRSSGPMLIDLTVFFVSRPDAVPISEPVWLESP